MDVRRIGPPSPLTASYVVQQVGTDYEARSQVGSSLPPFRGADAATVINNAVAQMVDGNSIIVKDDFTTTSPTIIIDKSIHYYHDGKMTINADNIAGLQLGIQGKQIIGSQIFVREIDGVNKGPQRYGFLMKNIAGCTIRWGWMKNLHRGIYYDPTGDTHSAGIWQAGCGENTLLGGSITDSTFGIEWAGVNIWMEGNFIRATILRCNQGLKTNIGGSSAFQTFIGVSDGDTVPASIDLTDEVGGSIWTFYFIRDGKYTIPDTSLLFNMQGSSGIGLGAAELRHGWMRFLNEGPAGINKATFVMRDSSQSDFWPFAFAKGTNLVGLGNGSWQVKGINANSTARGVLGKGTAGNRAVLQMWDATLGAYRYIYIDNGAWVISATEPT